MPGGYVLPADDKFGERRKTFWRFAKRKTRRWPAGAKRWHVGNLDVDRSLELYDLIRTLSQKFGSSFVVATHDPTLSDRVDRIVQMADGLIVGQS